MSVVAKFIVTSTEHFQHGGTKVKAMPVSASDDPKVTTPEDGAFFEATPSGSLEMLVNNTKAAEQFQPGDKFYVTFDRAAA